MVINVENKSNVSQVRTNLHNNNLNSSSETFDFFNSIISGKEDLSSEDTVKMYLKEIGKAKLLSKEELVY